MLTTCLFFFSLTMRALPRSLVVGANLTASTNVSTSHTEPVGFDLYAGTVVDGIRLPGSPATIMDPTGLLAQIDTGVASGNATGAPAGMRMCACSDGWTGERCLLRGLARSWLRGQEKGGTRRGRKWKWAKRG